MNTLVAINYNNYYNRLLRKEDSVEAYISGRSYKMIPNINFNPDDGITTKQVINWSESFSPNYLLVLDEEQNIVSRWFILHSNRTRGKQYDLSLRRDLLADYYNDLLTADMFVEKANPLKKDISSIFNNEGMELNQIKSKETLLSDATEIPWIVGYIAKNHSLTGSITIQSETDEVIPIGTTFENWEFNKNYVDMTTFIQFCTRYYAKVGLPLYSCQAVVDENSFRNIDHIFNIFEPDRFPIADYYKIQVSPLFLPDKFSNWVAEQIQKYYIDNEMFANLKNAASLKLDRIDLDAFDRLRFYNGKLLQDTNGVVKQFFISRSESYDSIDSIDRTAEEGPDATLTNLMLEPILAYSWFTQKYIADETFSIKTKYERYFLTLSEPQETKQTTLTWTTTPTQTQDAQYNMIAIPYGEIKVGQTGPHGTWLNSFTSNKQVGIDAAIAIAKELGSNLYDLQILPYLPIQSLIPSQVIYSLLQPGPIKIYKNSLLLPSTEQISYVKDGEDNILSFVLHCDKSNFTFDLPEKIEVGQKQIDKKLSNECDLYRLCSPNYSGLFEFSAAKNNGVLNFNVDCTYKPYSPYIHVNPNFSGLYGADYNDARGLVCGGDFSFGVITDQFKQYEINNKNYRDIFDRQIQSMDINNAINKQEATFQAIAGIGAGTVGGAATGAVAGGVYGAVAGAAVGGVASSIGGIMDLANLEKRQQEARSLSIDLYGYNLGNIKALPYSLTKLSALTYNNKLFPFVEYYTCTDEEKEALTNKIKFNGATIMKVGKFVDYTAEASDENMTRFFQGQIIRINEEHLAQEDADIIYEINMELAKGVYL